MIVSMTGFGKASVSYANKTIKTEIRTLNSKNLDMNVKIPGLYREKEAVLRNMLGAALERGKVELIICHELANGQAGYAINKAMLIQYYNEIKATASEHRIQISDDFFPELLRLPDMLKPPAEDLKPEEWAAAEKCVKEALQQVVEFRKSEGMHLYQDILSREKQLRQLLDDITPFEKDRIRNVRERIVRSLNELGEDVKFDQNRFEQEVIFYLEKLDITEEKVRLQKHLDYFNETLSTADNTGKKLGFICQEIGREINTIGSKANDAGMQRVVVQMKDELEKIKEQLMNVL